MLLRIIALTTIIFSLFSCAPDEGNQTVYKPQKDSKDVEPQKELQKDSKDVEPQKEPQKDSKNGEPQKELQKNPILIHFVGNSLTYNHNIPGKFLDIIKKQKIVSSDSKVNRTLRGATNLKSLFKEFAVKQILQPSQYISLQEQSSGVRIQETFDTIGMYQNLAKLTGAQIIYYAIWSSSSPGKPQCDYKLVSGEDEQFIQNHKLLYAPVGAAFEQACKNDISERLTPRSDHHAMRAGAYTAALTFVRVIFPKAFPLVAPPTFGISTADAAKIQQAVLKALPDSPEITAIPAKDPWATATRLEPENNTTHTITACRANLFTIAGINNPRKLRIQAEAGNYLNETGAGYVQNKFFTAFRKSGAMIKNDYPYNDYRHFLFSHDSTDAHFIFTPNQTQENCREQDFTITISLP